MSERGRVVYEEWRGGDQGHLSARQAGRLSPPRYEAMNLIYDRRNGGLSQRPGAGLRSTSAYAGTCVGMGFNGTPGADLWYALRDSGTGQVRIVLQDSEALTETDLGTLGVLAADEVVTGVEAYGSRTYLIVPAVGLYYIDNVLLTISLVDNTLGGHAIAAYGDRLYVGGVTASQPNRVYYSDALDFETFGALSWFDVGHGPEVRFLAEQRGHLTIALQDGSWWLLNGLVDAGGSLRRIAGGGVHPWHFYGSAAVQLGDSRIAFVPIDRDWPAFFDGARVTEETDRTIDESEFTTSPPADQYRFVAVRGVEPDEVVFRSGDDPSSILLNRRGAWTRLALDLDCDRPFMASDGQGYVWLACLDGTDFAVFRLELTGSVGPAASIGQEVVKDGGQNWPPYAWLYLPEWWHPEGANVMVRSVTVDFEHRYQQISADSTSLIACWVDALGNVTAASGAVTKKSSDYITKEPETGASAFSPLVGSQVTFNFGEQGHGRGFRVYLEELQGIIIHRVTVDYMVDPPTTGR